MSVPFRLYVITDRRLFPCAEALIQTLAAVAKSLRPSELAIQVREKDLATRDLLRLALDIKKAVSGTGTLVLVNDRTDVAIAAQLDGVHLPAAGMDLKDCKRIFRGVIGRSTHSVDELASCSETTFVTFGPIFYTPSKRPYGSPLGISLLQQAVAVSPVPVYAIGGIDETNASMLKGTGVAGIAVIRAVLAARDPARAALELIVRAGLRP